MQNNNNNNNNDNFWLFKWTIYYNIKSFLIIKIFLYNIQ